MVRPNTITEDLERMFKQYRDALKDLLRCEKVVQELIHEINVKDLVLNDTLNRGVPVVAKPSTPAHSPLIMSNFSTTHPFAESLATSCDGVVPVAAPFEQHPHLHAERASLRNSGPLCIFGPGGDFNKNLNWQPAEVKLRQYLKSIVTTNYFRRAVRRLRQAVLFLSRKRGIA